MSRGRNLVYNAINGVFLPRSPVQMPTSVSGYFYINLQPTYDAFSTNRGMLQYYAPILHLGFP